MNPIFKSSKLWLFLLCLLIVSAMPWYFVAREVEQQAAAQAVQEQTAPDQASAPAPQPAVQLTAGDMPIIGSQTDTKTIAVIIDNSWRNSISPLVVFALKSNHAHATFFVAGNWAAEHNDISRLIATEGNEFGILGNDYDQYDKATAEWIKDDLQKSAAAIKGVTGMQPGLYYPDNGTLRPAAAKAAAELGYKTVLWSVNANNQITRDADMVVGGLLQSVKPGAIVVFHVPTVSENFASILNRFLKNMAQQNYQVVSVSELLTKYSEKGIVRKPL